MRDTERERERERGRDTGRGRSGPYREPDMGLDPRTPGSCPGPKAGTKTLSHPEVPWFAFLLWCQVLSVSCGSRKSLT